MNPAPQQLCVLKKVGGVKVGVIIFGENQIDMSGRITYLLGAGASVGEPPEATKMPMVSGFKEYFDLAKEETWQWMADTLNAREINGQIEFHQNTHAPIMDEARDIINFIKSAALQNIDHFSIDTYAKKLWFQNRRDENLKLKALLSSIILGCQLNRGLDKRYEAFIASTLARHRLAGIAMPSNLNVLSWNYDLQFEEALFNVRPDSFNELFADFFKEPLFEANKYGFNYAKLNGAAGIWEFEGQIFKSGKFDELRKRYQDKDQTFTLYAYMNALKKTKERRKDALDNNDWTGIRFAWEQGIAYWENQFKNMASEEDNILVVIGYSFPNYNYEIDSKLLEVFKFDKVFLQCGSKNKEINERISSIYDYLGFKGYKIEPIEGKTEFYIPRIVPLEYEGEKP
jgi:hypothetical protein